MIKTTIGKCIPEELVCNYISSLVGCFFKILPMKENGELSLTTYMESLQVEIAGCSSLICCTKNDEGTLELLSILQYLIDHPECSVKSVKREVFKAINICNKLKAKISPEV